MDKHEYLTTMHGELLSTKDYYVSLREQFKRKRGELENMSRSIELLEELIALEQKRIALVTCQDHR